jgi:hypothetical protein
MQVKQFSGYDHDSSIEIKHLVGIGIKRNWGNWTSVKMWFRVKHVVLFILQDVIIFNKGIGNVLLNLVLI